MPRAGYFHRACACTRLGSVVRCKYTSEHSETFDMMQWTAAACLLVVVARGGGGVTKIPSASDISQFWTDDYKVFEQIYGRTSDKELYGATLPPTITYGIDLSHLGTPAASEKKERYIENEDLRLNDDLEAYGYGNRYNQLTKQSYKQITKPTRSPLKFIGVSELKPISQANDPETYHYLKHLEQLEKQKLDLPVQLSAGGFKPYLSYTSANPEEANAYKSIQDILEAHEANKGKNTDNQVTDDQLKYLTYGNSKSRSRGKTQKPVPISKPKSRCPSGRCRKRTASYRVRTRPYLRRIKHKIYY